MSDEQMLDDQAQWEGYVGTSAKKLELMSDEQLAVWQAGWKPTSSSFIMADREWQRRQAFRALTEQFRLEERLATVNRWWGLATAIIGVVGGIVGTLAGAWFGPQWQASSPPINVVANRTLSAQPTAPTDALQRATPASARR